MLFRSLGGGLLDKTDATFKAELMPLLPLRLWEAAAEEAKARAAAARDAHARASGERSAADEAAAKLRIDATSRPQALDVVSRRLLQVQMEQISLKVDAQTDTRAAARLAVLTQEAETLQAEQEALSARWEAEKGRLELESEVGVGTTVRMIFPARSGTVARETSSAVGHVRRVLVVEDHPLLRPMLAEALGHAG